MGAGYNLAGAGLKNSPMQTSSLGGSDPYRLADAFIQSNFGEYLKRFILKKQIDTGRAIKLSFKHCSNKYKLDRERLKKT